MRIGRTPLAPHRARAHQVHITEQGRTFSLEALAVRQQAATGFFEALKPEEQQQFRALLARLTQSKTSLDFFFRK